MKANRPGRTAAPVSPRSPWIGSFAIGIAVLALTASCVGPVVPHPARVPARPIPRPLPPAPPPPVQAPVTQAEPGPASPGVWRWRNEDGRSTARFVDGATVRFVMACRRETTPAQVALTWGFEPRSAPAATMLVRAGAMVRTLPARAAEDTARGGTMTASLDARDPLLDAMAFARGRFTVESPGLAPLALPSWPEVARVVDDCR